MTHPTIIPDHQHSPVPSTWVRSVQKCQDPTTRPWVLDPVYAIVIKTKQDLLFCTKTALVQLEHCTRFPSLTSYGALADSALAGGDDYDLLDTFDT